MSLCDRVAVVGVGTTKFGELFDRSYYDLVHEAATEALAMAGMEVPDVQAAWLGTCFPDMGGYEGNAGSTLADALGMFGKPVSRVANYCATGMDAFRNACFAVASGIYDRVLVVGAEKMRDVPSRESLVAQVVETGHPVHNKGLTAPGIFAMCATRYLARWGADRRLLAEVAIKNHAHGERNPKAHLRRRVTLEQVLGAPFVAEPLGLYDCCPQTDGAAAVVITRPDLVGDRPHVRVKGIGLAAGSSDFPFFDPDFDFLGFRATREAAREAYAQAGIRDPAAEIHVAEVHDCFTITELLNYEDLGLCGPGEARCLIEEGVTRIGGSLPVNPSGGLKSCGHPIGATGVRMIAEITLQLLHRAEERQAGEPRTGLAHNLGGPGAVACVTVLGAPGGERLVAVPMAIAASEPEPRPIARDPAASAPRPPIAEAPTGPEQDPARDPAAPEPSPIAKAPTGPEQAPAGDPAAPEPCPMAEPFAEQASGAASLPFREPLAESGVPSRGKEAGEEPETAVETTRVASPRQPGGETSGEQTRGDEPSGEVEAAGFFASLHRWILPGADLSKPLAVRFDLSGHRGGTWTVVVEDGAVRLDPAHPRSAAIVMASVEDFEAILGGRITMQMAFMTGRLKIRGDMSAGMSIRNLFRLGEIPTRPPGARLPRPEGQPDPLPGPLRPGTGKLLGDVTRAFLPDVSSRLRPEASRALEPATPEAAPPETPVTQPTPGQAWASHEAAPPTTAPQEPVEPRGAMLPGESTIATHGDPPRPAGLPGAGSPEATGGNTAAGRAVLGKAPADDAADPDATDLDDLPSVDEVFASLPDRFDREAAEAGGASVVYHIAIDSPEQDDWSISIQDGDLVVEPGRPLAPDATLIMSARDWAALILGRLSDKAAILTGRIKVRGSKPDALLLKTYFRLGPLA